MLIRMPEELDSYIMDGVQHAIMHYKTVPALSDILPDRCYCDDPKFGEDLCPTHRKHNPVAPRIVRQQEDAFEFVVWDDGSIGMQDEVDFILPSQVRDIQQALAECKDKFVEGGE